MTGSSAFFKLETPLHSEKEFDDDDVISSSSWTILNRKTREKVSSSRCQIGCKVVIMLAGKFLVLHNLKLWYWTLIETRSLRTKSSLHPVIRPRPTKTQESCPGQIIKREPGREEVLTVLNSPSFDKAIRLTDLLLLFYSYPIWINTRRKETSELNVNCYHDFEFPLWPHDRARLLPWC